MMSIAQAQQQHKQIRECCPACQPLSGLTNRSPWSGCHTHSHAPRTTRRDPTRPIHLHIVRCSLSSSIRISRRQLQYQPLDQSRDTTLSQLDHQPKKASSHLPHQSRRERQRGMSLQRAFHARRRILGESQDVFLFSCRPLDADVLTTYTRCDGTCLAPGIVLIRSSSWPRVKHGGPKQSDSRRRLGKPASRRVEHCHPKESQRGQRSAPRHMEASSEAMASISRGRAKSSAHHGATAVAKHALASAINVAKKKDAENTWSLRPNTIPVMNADHVLLYSSKTVHKMRPER